MAIHKNYNRISDFERKKVDEAYKLYHRSLNASGIMVEGDDRAERVVEAMATQIFESTPSSHQERVNNAFDYMGNNHFTDTQFLFLDGNDWFYAATDEDDSEVIVNFEFEGEGERCTVSVKQKSEPPESFAVLEILREDD